MVNVTIIDTMKTKELDNGKFMTTHKAQDLEAKQYTFNFFGQPLKKGIQVELVKQGLYWNFVKIIEDEEVIPTANDYIIKEQDKYLYGMAGNIAYDFYKDTGKMPIGLTRTEVKKNIKEVFETLKESRKECLGY
jgi:hypothetical protein